MKQAQRRIKLVNSLAEPQLAEIVATDFEPFFGELKNKPLFDGKDGVETQRSLRDEWN